ncbi:chemotaxis protein CheC, inhibitor of MCP methylation [Halobacteroides halobius DSM 5150]|uniref:Chemotaxis protein CheC, inhibitor of MCP methylation n=1 Tax=Halobacteroides halobius (strain ATCC 35273 / DSM 5150 / MD-1) TaxID=748449 RepID=L0K7X4_HALHC|nr:chemotaxis protein CheC [Halobacteroides halobius]AGB40650.1 chemotaxis protein CheC, inhibitor of MCP methylation [Halobacteroides halobius DSM 5150]
MPLDDELSDLNPLELDALKEVASIGAGNAATSLSRMIDSKIEMSVPKVDILPVADVPEIIGGAEKLIAAVLVRIEGEINGGVLFTLDTASANLLIELLTGMDINIEEEMGELEASALKEIGNILTGANLNAFSKMLNIKIKPQVPALAYDMSGAILEVCFIELGQVGDYALVIETDFLSDLEEDINGNFFLIPNPDSLQVILNKLGVSDV